MKLGYVGNCVNLAGGEFDDATEMAGIVENAVKISEVDFKTALASIPYHNFGNEFYKKDHWYIVYNSHSDIHSFFR